MAQEEVDRLGDRVRDTRKHNVAQGWHTPGRAPWGYRWRARTDSEKADGAPASVLVPDEITAPYAREAFRMVAGGSTPGAVALWAARLPDEAKGVVPRLVKDKATGKKERLPLARQLNQSAIRVLLRSSVYIGRFDDGEHEGERGHWEPLIDQNTWDVVQARIGNTKRRSGPVSGQHLLTSMIICPKCGSRMAGWVQAQTWKRYRCNSFTLGGEKTARNCMYTVSAAPVDAEVTERVARLLAPLAEEDPKLRLSMARAWERRRKPTDQMAKERARQIEKAKQDKADAIRRLGDAARLLVDEKLDSVAYKALADAETARLNEAERTLTSPEITASMNTLPPLADVLTVLRGWQSILTTGAGTERRELLRLLIESVVPVRLSHGRYTVDLVWSALGREIQEALGEPATA